MYLPLENLSISSSTRMLRSCAFLCSIQSKAELLTKLKNFKPWSNVKSL